MRTRGGRERAERLMALYVEGKTLDEVGIAEGVTRERVRQILMRYLWQRYQVEQHRRGRSGPDLGSFEGNRIAESPLVKRMVEAGASEHAAWMAFHSLCRWFEREGLDLDDWAEVVGGCNDAEILAQRGIGPKTLEALRSALPARPKTP